EHSEPELDIALLRRRDDEYLDVLPESEDILLIVEVADTSLEYDRSTKLRLYAQAGIRESWLLSLPEDRLFVCRDPSPDGYRTIPTLSRGDFAVPLAFPDISLSVTDILGPPREPRRNQTQ